MKVEECIIGTVTVLVVLLLIVAANLAFGWWDDVRPAQRPPRGITMNIHDLPGGGR
ncbi:MAG: hypothetical protein AB1568_04620 [Thermodesulfobacteriota bacterium]